MSEDINMFSTYFHYRVAILGEPQVGKTCILNQLVNKKFLSTYKPTLETDMEYLHEYKGTTYVCLIIDTAGVQEFPAMRRLSITRSNGFLIVFDLTKNNTFEKAKSAVEEVLSYKQEQYINVILIGNKKDQMNKRDRVCGSDISDNANILQMELNKSSLINCQYFEVSASSNGEITRMFEKLLDLYDMKHLREGSHLIASLRNRRRNPGMENQPSRRPSRLSADFEPSSATRSISMDDSNDEKVKRYSLPKGFFPSPSPNHRKVSSTGTQQPSQYLTLPEKDIC